MNIHGNSAMEKWCFEPNSFVGTLGKDGDQVDVTFTAGLDLTGQLVLTFDSIPFNKNSEFISEHFYAGVTRFAKFSLTGVATDGTTFECGNVIFTSLGSKCEENSDTFTP